MKNDIPEIEDLLNGIKGQEIGKPSKPDSGNHSEKENPNTAETDNDTNKDKYWQTFLDKLNHPDPQQDKDDRLVCKLDRDLADSLDDCDIGNKCRSDLVNAMIRAFFNVYMDKLVMFRREKKSLFKNFTKPLHNEGN
ncbi:MULTISPECIES: hypothetical protein [Bacteroidales]|uniref:hypothetical protein n=1 Tax=Bacteroidales TaxID=171549 RepID=UPI00258B28DF|nr:MULTISPECIES: hypothetical protein [Bacteroidales]